MVCFTALQVESYTLNILEKGIVVKEIVEVDVYNQTEVIRVPQHNDVDAMEMMNDFKEVRFKLTLEKAGMISGLTDVQVCKFLALQEVQKKWTKNEGLKAWRNERISFVSSEFNCSPHSINTRLLRI